MDPH